MAIGAGNGSSPAAASKRVEIFSYDRGDLAGCQILARPVNRHQLAAVRLVFAQDAVLSDVNDRSGQRAFHPSANEQPHSRAKPSVNETAMSDPLPEKDRTGVIVQRNFDDLQLADAPLFDAGYDADGILLAARLAQMRRRDRKT